MGPIDGHDIGMMCEALETAKSLGAPVLLHVNTVKGKGYNYAEKDPSHFHGVSDFDIDTGEPHSSGDTFCNEFGKLMCKVTHGKVNPLIGSAGVSAVPMAARVSQKVGAQADPTNFLLMHAMGPNVAGVIGTAVAAGTFMAIFGVF